jgi:hypothetical protein
MIGDGNKHAVSFGCNRTGQGPIGRPEAGVEGNDRQAVRGPVPGLPGLPSAQRLIRSRLSGKGRLCGELALTSRPLGRPIPLSGHPVVNLAVCHRSAVESLRHEVPHQVFGSTRRAFLRQSPAGVRWPWLSPHRPVRLLWVQGWGWDQPSRRRPNILRPTDLGPAPVPRRSAA